MKKLTNWWNNPAFKFIIGALVIIAIMSLYAFIIHNINFNYAVSGAFGDQFGAVNTFFSALAFWAIYLTFLNQKHFNNESLKSEYLSKQEDKFLFLLEILKENFTITKGEICTSESPTGSRREFTSYQYYQNIWGQLNYLNRLLKADNFTLEDNFASSIINQYIKCKADKEKVIDDYKEIKNPQFGNILIPHMYLYRYPEINSTIRAFNTIINFMNIEHKYFKNKYPHLKEDEIERLFNSYSISLRTAINDESLLLFLYINIYRDHNKINNISFFENLIYKSLPKSLYLEEEDYRKLFINKTM